MSSKKDGKLIKSGRWVLRCVYLAISARGSKKFSPTTFPQISVTQNVFNLRRFALCSNHFCERLSLDPVLQSALCSAPCQLSQINTRFSHFDVHVIDSTFGFMIPHHWLPFTLLFPLSPLRIVFKSRFPPHQLCCSSSDNCLIVRNGDEEEERIAEKSFFIWASGLRGAGVEWWAGMNLIQTRDLRNQRCWRHRLSREMF